MPSVPRSAFRIPSFPASWPWFAAALSGILLALCFPPYDLGGLSWLALTPLIAALWFSKEREKHEDFRCFLLGYVTGVIYFLGCFAWVHTVTILGWIALCLYVAVYPAIFAAFVGRALKPRQSPFEATPIWQKSINNLLVSALVATTWVSLEWVRSVLFSGFGWDTLGIALHDNVALIQVCDITGVGGLSFMLVMVNAMIVLTAKRLQSEFGRHKLRPHYDFSFTVAIVGVVFAYGAGQVYQKKPEAEYLNIAAIQGNIPVNEKRDLENDKRILDLHIRRSEQAFAMSPDLLIWPEATTPRPINDEETGNAVKALAERAPGDFLLGTVSFDDDGGYNSALLLTEGGTKHKFYHKVHLVPYGEYVPMRHSFPPLAWAIGDLVPDDFTFGQGPVVLQMSKKDIKLAPLICFEDTLGDLARGFVLKGAQVFVTVTNDGWFLKTAESRQHLNNAIFRCAETKLPMIRAANTGISCVVDRLGRVIAVLADEKGDTFIEGTLFARQVEVPKNPALTFYVRYGEVFTYACIGITALAGVVAFFRRERRSPNSST